MADTLDPTPQALHEFLAAEKACPDPAPEVQQRVFSRLATTLAIGDGAADAPETSTPNQPFLPATSSGRSLASMVGRGLHHGWATFLLGAAVGATTYGAVEHIRHKPEAPQTPAVLLAPPASESPAAPPERPPLSEPAPAALAPARAVDPRNGPAVQSRDGRLAAERNLLEMARTSLARGRTDGALATLRRHARLYPNGQLAEEREGLMVQALVDKGDTVQARERAARFHRQHPHSLFAPVVDQALQSIP